ncbi:hypothetical protein D3C72_2358160 [compost metagenome]
MFINAHDLAVLKRTAVIQAEVAQNQHLVGQLHLSLLIARRGDILDIDAFFRCDGSRVFRHQYVTPC